MAQVLSSVQPDIKLLARLMVAQKIALIIVGVVAGCVLLGWLIPPFGQLLPTGWNLMKANSALGALLGAGCMAISQLRHGEGWMRLHHACAAVLAVMAGSALWAHWGGHITGIETLLAGDSESPKPGRMSIQTASFFMTLSVTLFFIHARKSAVADVVDFLTFALVALALVIFSGYCFGAAQLFGESTFTRTSPQTLLCIILLTFIRVGHRAEYGFFSVIVGVGIGSRIARIVLPFAFILPFLLVIGGAYTTVMGWLSAPYAAALTASLTALLLFSLILWMAWRINDLERDLRDMSLTDELTRVYNLRGFSLLGEQALREARRIDAPLTALFFDLDGLKQINDQFGHDAGSRMLQDFSGLLRVNFRDSDIIGRVGGDEFSVVMHGGSTDAPRVALQRLDDAIAGMNQRHDRPYRIGYSVGDAVSASADNETFTELLRRADALMYTRKSAKKALMPRNG